MSNLFTLNNDLQGGEKTMSMNTDLKAMGMLFLGLFLVGILVAISYIGFGYLKETACEMNEDTQGSYAWTNGACYNSTGTAATVTAVTKIGVVESTVNIALGLLALIVVVAIFAIVIKTARGFSKTAE